MTGSRPTAIAWRSVPVLVFAWAFAPIAALLVHTAIQGGTISGIDGILAGADQFQYLAWIREAASGPLVSNSFDLGESDRVYLQPMYALGGLLWEAGVPIQGAYFVLKLVAVVSLAWGFRAYVARTVEGRTAGLLALLVALAYLSPLTALLDWGGALEGWSLFEGIRTSAESSTAALLWGYPAAAAAVGLMPVYLLACERAADPARRAPGRSAGWYLGWASAAGAACSWLHPWQGVIIILVTWGVVVWARLGRRHWLLAIPTAASLAPLVYVSVLARTDPVWERVADHDSSPGAPAWAYVAALAPLLVPAAFEAVRAPRDLQDRALRLWPVIALALAAGLAPSAPLHALQGVSLPLAILAVRALARVALPRGAVAVLAAVAVVPGGAYALNLFDRSVDSGLAAYRIKPGEAAALDYLEDNPRTGGVLATPYLGAGVPAFTGRKTWVAHFAWTPDHAERRRDASRLFAAQLTPQAARSLVQRSGAAFLLADCSTGHEDLSQLLGSVVVRRLQFGCAAVYELRTGRDAST